ncbi:MAG: hypothetical protein ABJE66_22630 [Deltaproteobacteria bacterium]
MQIRKLAILMLVVCLTWACGGKKKGGIAELTKADGAVERQPGVGPWQGALVGAVFYMGDAARTADGSAQITLTGSQVIEMQPHTVLRFGAGKNNVTDVVVELGGIDVVNSSTAALEIGNVKVAPGGKIRITANNVELLIGNAQINGSELVIGRPIGLELGAVTAIDAGVDAAPPAPPDAGVSPGGDIAYEITGTGAELQAPGAKTWAPVAAGKGTIPVGAKLRLKKAGAKAVLVSGTATLELAGASSQITIHDDLLVGMELGTATASVPAQQAGKVGVPGGEVDIAATKDAAAEARIEVNARGEAKVAMVHGGAKLVGTNGSSTLEMAGGESATLLKAGTINPGVVIPRYFDFKIVVGDAPKSFVVHDPKGSTALQFAFNSKCPSGGTVEMDHDARFRTPRVSEGKESANMLLQSGSWVWRLRCAGGAVAASGQIAVVTDAGRRPLPPKPSKNSIDADGRVYDISYQSLIPNVDVKYKGTATTYKLHLATGGSDEVFESSTPMVEIPGKKLKEASYMFWFEKPDGKQDKVTTLKITFDQTAAQVYIESPIEGAPFGGEIDVSGAALPGWTAKVDAVEIPITDLNTRRFHAKVQPPSGGAQAIAIRLSHPQRGVHFYLRRGATK